LRGVGGNAAEIRKLDGLKMLNLLKSIHNCIDQSVSICDKYLRPFMHKGLRIYQNDYSGGTDYGTDHALKRHANSTAGPTNSPRLFPRKSTLQTRNPPKILPETVSCLSQDSSPSSSLLWLVAQVRGWM
jgi:hypothetical protein